MSVFTDVNNIPATVGALGAAGDAAALAIAEQILARIEYGFKHGQDAMGRPWTPLSPETVRRKGNSDILIESGKLSTSFKVERTSRGARVVSHNPLAAIHEHGIPERGLPARPIIGPAEVWGRKRALSGAALGGAAVGGMGLGKLFQILRSVLR